MKISDFLSKNFQFLEVNFSIYLNRRIFVMTDTERKSGPTSSRSLISLRCPHKESLKPWPSKKRPLKILISLTRILSGCTCPMVLRGGSRMISEGIRFHRITYSTYPERQARANSADPDQTPQNAASDLGLHCLPLNQKFYTHSQVVQWTG